MRTLVTGKQMKEIDAYTIQTIGIPSMVLMERAAFAVAEEVKALAGKEELIWAVCGTGNNGADGIAAARILYLEGFRTEILLVGDPQKGSAEFLSQLSIARNLNIPVYSWQEAEGRHCQVLIDAIFGVGLGREIQGEYQKCMEFLGGREKENEEKSGREWIPRLRVAVDVPSGIHADTGAVMGIALQADVTVTFGWEKLGTALYPGKTFGGKVIVASIGFPEAALLKARQAEESWDGKAVTYTAEDLRLIPGRPAHTNKGSFGHVLIAAGSENMCGAAYLSALSAYRTGAGLVKILTVEENRQILQTLLPEAILSCYTPGMLMEGRQEFKTMIEKEMNWADVVVLGPGLGSDPYVEYLVEDILTSAFVPVIIDADGLNCIAAHPYLTTYYTENIIITPHLGEMARLTGESIKTIQENLPETARQYAMHYGITCVLKDAATVVSGKDGTLFINSSGNSAMAKAGSGDVLTGVIAGLTAIGMEEEDAAMMGVYLHGAAGDIAAGGRPHSLLATELADAVGTAMNPEMRQQEDLRR